MSRVRGGDRIVPEVELPAAWTFKCEECGERFEDFNMQHVDDIDFEN